MLRLRRLGPVLILLAGLVLASGPARAGAHPLGNFTVNHYSALTVGADQITVLYVLDMAEIPTYQELGTIRADHSADLTPTERADYIARKSAELLPGLTLTVAGQTLPLSVVAPGELAL